VPPTSGAAAPRAVTEPGVVAASELNADGELVLVMADGSRHLLSLPDGTLQPFDALPPMHSPLSWTADGKKLYVRAVPSKRTAARPLEVKLFDPDTQTLAPFTTVTPPDLMGLTLHMKKVLVSGDGHLVVYAYNSTEGELFLVDGLAKKRP
jgi:hypothetical protein